MDTIAPATADDLAAALAACSAEARPVVPLGSGAHQHHGAAPPVGALRLSTAALDRVVEYTPADLTATVEAGITLAALQEALGRHGQWLPWDPPGAARATVGGLLAAGLSGPMRLGAGSPRDWVLGMRVALGDGRLVKSGGRVVKNVAGYDSHKLHIGALGTLGVICEVTFKLAPLPERVATLLVACPSRAAALALADALRARPLAPASLMVADCAAALLPGGAGDVALAVRYAGVPAAVERQLREAVGRIRAAGLAAAEQPEDQARALWGAVSEFPSGGALEGGDGVLVLRAGARPSALPALAEALERHAPPGAATVLMPGVGLAYGRWPGGAEEAGRLAALRAELAAVGGYAVVEDAPAALRAGLDLWGPPPPTLAVMRRLKAQWDPAGILNPGRYVAGI